jgi:hypothetical protein
MKWTNFDNGKEIMVLLLEFQVERYFPPSYKTKSTIAERYRCQVATVTPIKPPLNLIELSDDVRLLRIDGRRIG